MHNYTELKNCINKYNDIVIITHTNMDGDALGSSTALCAALRQLGKNAVVYVEDKIPDYLNVINHDVNKPDDVPYYVSVLNFKPEIAFAVDIGERSRLEDRVEAYDSAEVRLCIDHHQKHDDFADYSVVHEDYAAAGLLVYEFIKELGVNVTQDMAKALYTAIATDTGRFKYNSTTSEVLRAVAELYEYDINASEICTAVFDSKPLVQLKAEAVALENVEILAGGKVVVSYITKDQMNKIGALYEHVDTCIDRIRLIEGVEIAIFIKEKEVGLNKLSLRAKSYANVARLAGELGGGGHEKASGATLKCSLEEALIQAKAAAEREIARF